MQEVTHRSRVNIIGDDSLPDGFEQNEGQLAALHLLVLRQQRHQPIGVGEAFLREARNVLQPRRQPGVNEMALDARGIIRRDHAELRREFGSQHHADGDALAMIEPIGEAGDGFQRVPKV